MHGARLRYDSIFVASFDVVYLHLIVSLSTDTTGLIFMEIALRTGRIIDSKLEFVSVDFSPPRVDHLLPLANSDTRLTLSAFE